MGIPIAEAVARKLGGQAVLGTVIRSQADLAHAVRNRLPLTSLEGHPAASAIKIVAADPFLNERHVDHGVRRTL